MSIVSESVARAKADRSLESCDGRAKDFIALLDGVKTPTRPSSVVTVE